MRTATIVPLSLLLLAPVSLACDHSEDSRQPTDEAAGGKADGESAVEVAASDEPLMAATLRQQLCGAIGSAHPWSTASQRNAFVDDCLDHEFTVTETSTSTLYAHLDDGDAMTMRLRVQVTAGDNTWQTSLTREFSDFRFRWAARVDSLPDGDERDAFIEDLADDMGEFFSPDEFPDNFRTVPSMDEFPAEVRDTVLTRLAELSDEISEGSQEGLGALLSDELPNEIVRDGEVVGYVAEIGYIIDHPLFDGGGTTLYLNVLGEIVEEVEWFG